MTAILFFVIVIVILAVCQSQNSEFVPQTRDFDNNSIETVTKPTEESIISFGGLISKETIQKPPEVTVSTPNETVCPVTKLETKGPVNLYIHGAFATTNKGRCVAHCCLIYTQTVRMSPFLFPSTS